MTRIIIYSMCGIYETTGVMGSSFLAISDISNKKVEDDVTTFSNFILLNDVIKIQLSHNTYTCLITAFQRLFLI